MVLVQTEKYLVNDRSFKILTYKDSVNNILIIEPVEVTNGDRNVLEHLKAIVSIDNNSSLKPEEYPEYFEKLITTKQAILMHVNAAKQ